MVDAPINIAENETHIYGKQTYKRDLQKTLKRSEKETHKRAVEGVL